MSLVGESDSRCLGIAIDRTDSSRFICRCCGESIRLVTGEGDAAEFSATPGGMCWSCGLGQCPPHCRNYVDLADDVTALDIERWELQDRMGGPCSECGEMGACSYDFEGRPMVHVVALEEDDA
jgi:hypothetical protein